MSLPPGLRHVLAETRLFTDGEPYVILRLPLNQHTETARALQKSNMPFLAMVRDKDEVTLVSTVSAWDIMRPALDVKEESPEYRLITFDLPMDLGLVGYLATITAALAEEGVSIFAVSAFSRDHILVQTEDFDTAWETLRDLIHTCKIEEAGITE